MFNGKYISIDFIIDKIQQDYEFTTLSSKIEIADDVFDAMDLIGVPLALRDRITNGEGDNPDVISIEDYCAELPCDLRYITGVRMHETGVPLVTESSIYKASKEDPGMDHHDTDYPVYHVNDSLIFTNFETGDIEISYKAFPSDESGLPMIPDNTRYIKAVTAYVAERIGFRLWFRKLLDDKRYESLKDERYFYMASAPGAMHMPSYDQAESLKNQLNRMVRFSNHHLYGFKYLNNQERDNINK